MKTFAMIAVVALGLAAVANAECANACSGHGTCGQNDECACFPNWMAADCSERVCPYGLAFVDTPRGDLNHNGVRDAPSAVDGLVSTMRSNFLEWEQFPPTAAELTANSAALDTKYGAGAYIAGQVSKDNEAHFYTECSAKGVCDRELGMCQCFDGYSGSSCQRTVCPNDCSGHGVCRTVEEVADGGMNYKKTDSAGGVNYHSGMSLSSTLSYRLWDHDKSQACVCDAGYSGADCSRRECPRGDDPLTFRQAECGGAASCTAETQVFTLTSTAGPFVEWRTLSFRDWTGEVWRTDYFPIGTEEFDGCVSSGTGTFVENTAAQLKASLEAIPNGVFNDVDVTVVRTSDLVLTVTFAFNGNPGNIESLDWSVPSTAQSARGNHGSCPGADIVVASIAVDASGVITTTTDPHNFVVGDTVTMTLVDTANPMHGTFTVASAPSTSTFTVRDAAGALVDNNGGTTTTGTANGHTSIASNGDSVASPGTSEVAMTAASVDGNREESTCSNRGLCDYETGLCKCFRGYYKGDCSSQNALAGSVASAL